jgi:hypothetical protein
MSRPIAVATPISTVIALWKGIERIFSPRIDALLANNPRPLPTPADLTPTHADGAFNHRNSDAMECRSCSWCAPLERTTCLDTSLPRAYTTSSVIVVPSGRV